MNKRIAIYLIVFVWVIGLVNASFLDREESCSSSWYCTSYSQESCGMRSCVDINLCDVNKPVEFVSCQSNDLIPQGFFVVNKDAIKMTIEQEKVIQQIITVNSSVSEEHTLSINYPSSYTKGTDFITTTSNKKNINQKGDFTIIIDTRNILVGTYVIPVNISNKDYSKTILLIIDVVPKNNPKITLETNSKIITLERDKEISVNLEAKGQDIVSGNKLTYELIDSSGNVILMDEKSFSAIDNQETLLLPKEITEGRYTLSAKISGITKNYVKSITFTAVTPGKYNKTSSEKNSKIWLIILVVILIVGIITAIIIKRSMPYKPYSKRKHYSYYGGVGILRSSFGKPDFNTLRNGFSLDLFGGIKRAITGATRIVERKELGDAERTELLKRSYERGFISQKEYHEAIKSRESHVETKIETKIEEKRKEIQIEKKEEKKQATNFMPTKQEIELEKEMRRLKEEKEKKEKEREKQQKEMEKEAAELAKQEQALKKELEKQKELREKQEKEEREKEAQRKKEIERIKAEIEAEQKELERLKKEARESPKVEIRDVRLELKPVEAKEKPSVHPMSHIMVKDVIKEKEVVEEKPPAKQVKENILDKKVNDQQAFGMSNGERLYSLRDLLEALPHVQEHVFDHHTKQGRNDFANWIGDVFKYYDIAEQVRNSDSKEEIIRILKKHD